MAQRMDMCVLGDTTGLEGDAEGALKGRAADRFPGGGSTDAATSLIAVYKALGAGWSVSESGTAATARR